LTNLIFSRVHHYSILNFALTANAVKYFLNPALLHKADKEDKDDKYNQVKASCYEQYNQQNR
jgi:hypothetical protein